MVVEGRSESVQKDATSMKLLAEREIVIERVFNAKAQIVFDAWTRPELVRRWWAPKSHRVSVVSLEADVRVGGRYRYVLRKEEGAELAFSGTYTEVTPPTRLVYTQIFESVPGDPVIVTVTFEEVDGKTRLVAHEVYPTKEARDAALASGMEHGMRETMNQLEELVASL
jgi:uncharacterized protein YndB with AHSA1/START domain